MTSSPEFGYVNVLSKSCCLQYNYIIIYLSKFELYSIIMIARFLLHIIVSAMAVLAAEWLVPGVIYKYDFISLVKIALFLALANTFVKPLVKLIAGPLILLTLGFFTLIINIFLIWIVVKFSSELSVVGLGAYFWTMLVISAFNFIVSTATHKRESN